MKELMRFQTDRNLHLNEYSAINEHGNIVEELLESVGLDVPKANRPQLKEEFERFIGLMVTSGIAKVKFEDHNTMPVGEKVDAYADMITFATGAIMKLNHDPIISVQECGKEINSRVGTIIDNKFEKDLSDEAKANWYKADYTKAEI